MLSKISGRLDLVPFELKLPFISHRLTRTILAQGRLGTGPAMGVLH